MEAIGIHALTRRYGTLTALDGVSFSVGRGELFGLIGPDGAGKTTLFRLLATLLEPDSGRAEIDGLDIVRDYRAIRRRVGYMPGRFSLYPDLSVEENLAFFAALFGTTVAENYDLVAPIYRQIEPFRKRRAGKLSGGMKQKLALSCALIHRPPVLLLDEPLGALDLRLRKDMQNELKNIQQRMGITFIYVTHDQEEALTMSDTIVVMNKGKIQQIGRPEDIYNEPKNAFVADFIGESNILDGVMLEDYVVKFFGRKFQCVDKGFAPNEPVDVVIRPEDVDIVPPEQGHLCGTVTSVTFKGVHYDTIVDFKGFKWLIQTTDYCPVDAYIGIRLNPEDIHIMHKSEYSGLYGDYSSYSAEYDEIADASEEEADEE